MTSDLKKDSPRLESAVSDAFRALRRVGNRIYLQSGVSHQQAAILMHLERHGPRTQNELAALMNLEKATIASLLLRMEQADLIKRSVSPSDRRARIVRLSASAGPLVSRIQDSANQVLRRGRAGVSAADRQTAVKVLRILTQNLMAMASEMETLAIDE